MYETCVYAKTRVRPGKRDELPRLFEGNLAPRAEANPLQGTVIGIDNQDPDTHCLSEVYGDRKAFETNGQAPKGS